MIRGQYLAIGVGAVILGFTASAADAAKLGSQAATQAAMTAQAAKKAAVAATLGPMSVRSPEGRAAITAQRAQPGAPNAPTAWSNALTMPAGQGVIRFGHAQCDTQPNSFYVIAGVNETFSTTPNSWRYDAVTNTWNPLAPIPSGQEGPIATCFQGFIYVAAGGGTNGFFIYDVTNDTWSPGAVVPRPVWGAAMGAFAGKVYLIGGDSDFTFGGTSNLVNIYDIATNTWTGTGTPMPSPVVAGGFGQVGPDVYIVGGWNDSSPGANSTATLRYNMPGDTWTTGPTFTSARSDLALGITAANLYAIAGDANGGGAFDPSNNVDFLPTATFPGGAWTSAGDPIPAALTAVNAGFCTNAMAGGEVWALDGVSNPFPTFNSVNQFRPSEPCPSAGPPAPIITADGSTLTAEGCGPANGAIDPDELVTVDFGLHNIGTLDTVDLVATLQASGGVNPVTTTQDYGVLVAGGATVTRPFQFSASGTCGASFVATLHLQDGATDLGTANFTFQFGTLVTVVIENFDGVTPPALPAGWVTTSSGAESPWVTDATQSDTAPNAAFAPDPPAIGDTFLDWPTMTLSSPGTQLQFRHFFNLEDTFDGGVLEISINGGPFDDIIAAGGSFVTGAYTDTISTSFGSPIGGRQAWSGNSGGFITTTVNLPPAAVGQTIQLRWRCASDSSVSIVGWWVDSISLVTPQCCSGPASEISIGDVTVTEGNSGPTPASFPVTLTPASGGTVTVDFNTVDGTATTADNDYSPLSGTVTFAPGQTTAFVTIDVIGDLTFEPDENFFVTLTNAVGAVILDGQGIGTILNDDKPLGASTRDELVHDSRETRDLDTISRFWRISQKSHSSYEVIVDAVTGDIVGSGGPELLRVDSDGTTVLQTGVPATSGSSKSLRFENAAAANNDVEFIRVHSTGCVADCDTSDTFRIRAYDTTYRMSRFNNSATQITVVLVANPTDQPVTGTLWFYQGTGVLLASQAVSIPPKATFVLNTSTIAALQGQGGSATFSNDAAFGALAGKAVAVEPATGFTFDTPMVPRTATTKMVPRDN